MYFSLKGTVQPEFGLWVFRMNLDKKNKELVLYIDVHTLLTVIYRMEDFIFCLTASAIWDVNDFVVIVLLNVSFYSSISLIH